MGKYKNILLLLSIINSNLIFSKRVLYHDRFKSAEKNIRDNVWFKILPLEKILEQSRKIVCHKCFGEVAFEFDSFPLSSLIPHKGYFKECFILEIPRGQVQGKEGFVVIDDTIPQEMVWADRYTHLEKIIKIKNENAQKISGRVAVIAQEGYFNYCHFINELLGRLAILEIHAIEYDWLYVPFDSKFIRDGLKLWGIDESKIISPTDKNFCIQADTVILPSLVLNTNNGFRHAGVNAHPYTLQYVKEKLLSKIENKVDTSNFSKKIFISRRDAPARRILNEDEIFELFKAQGFERYDMGKMSIEEQITLFAQAEMVVGEHGAGLTNILFCKEGTKVIELFQALIDTSFWFPAQIFNLDYTPVNTLGINAHYFANWAQINPNIYCKAQNSKVEIPLESIRKIVK